MTVTTTNLTLCNNKGAEMTLYYDTAVANDCATPVWVANKAIVGDLNINDTADKEEQTSRDPAIKYKQYSQSRPDLEITGEMMVDPLYEGYSHINSAKVLGAPRNFLILTFPITKVGAVGFKGKFNNYDTSVSGPESGPGRTQFSLAPAACVVSACNIATVEVLVANAVVAYDPGVFVPAAAGPMSLAEQIMSHAVYKGLHNTGSEVIYTDIGPLIQWIGVDGVDELLADLTEAKYTPTGIVSARRRAKNKPVGIGEFDREALVKVLDEIVKNSKEYDELVKKQKDQASDEVSF